MTFEIKDLTGVSKPVKKLLDICDKWLEPRYIERRANAEVVASLIRHEGEVKLSILKEQAAQRLLAQELQKQENIRSIIQRALIHAGDCDSTEAEEGNLDHDWIFRFCLEAQEISDETLQDLWARLLARASHEPKKFPRRLFHAVKDLEPSEVKMIDELARRVLFVERHDGSIIPFLNVHVIQEWAIKASPPDPLLLSSPVESAALLQELRILDPIDFTFSFAGEGLVHGEGFKLSRSSALRIFSKVGEIAAEHQQPGFISMDGATLGDCEIKSILFDGWRITEVGLALFSLSKGLGKDLVHLEALAGTLGSAGMKLRLKVNEV